MVSKRKQKPHALVHRSLLHIIYTGVFVITKLYICDCSVKMNAILEYIEPATRGVVIYYKTVTPISGIITLFK